MRIIERKLFILLVIAIIFTILYGIIPAKAQTDDPFVGEWKFAMNEKIDYNVMMDSAKAFGYNTTTKTDRAMLFAGIAQVVLTRCEYATLSISSFENTVLLKIKHPTDPTAEDMQWGEWHKLKDGNYMIKFDNRIEFYQLNKITGEYYLKTNPIHNIFNELLKDNLKLVPTSSR